MSQPLILNLELLFESPLLSASSGVETAFADRTTVRGTDGRPILPASSLKGRWRHACERLLRALGQDVCDAPRPAKMCASPPFCRACSLFGSPSRPSRLRFYDLRAETSATAVRHSVSLNRRRRQAEEGRLFVSETSVAGVRFSGRPALTGAVDEVELALLLASLREIQAWGGGRTRGLGWTQTLVEGTWEGQTLRMDGVSVQVPFRWEVLQKL